MKTRKTINTDIRDILDLKSLIQIYEELAALKMQKTRKEIVSSRQFFEGLARLSSEVGSDFSQAQIGVKRKTACVLVTANTGLYGDIIDKTFALFFDFVKKNKADIFIIGRLGKQLVDQYAKTLKYQLLDFSDDDFNEQNFKEVIGKILPYRQVMIFYGKFENIAVQNPITGVVSGELLVDRQEEIRFLQKKRLLYLYEPSIEEISAIFARQIFASVIEQMLRESQLAKFAARLMHLDRSLEEMGHSLKELDFQKRAAVRKMRDKKQKAMIARVMAGGII